MVNYSQNLLKKIFKKNDNTNLYDKLQVFEKDQSRLLEYFASFASNHPDLIIVLSPDGKIISQNHKDMKKILGFHPTSKTDLKSLVGETTQSLLKRAFNNTLKGKTSRHEIKINDRSGSDIYLLLTFIPIKVGDNPVEGVYLIVNNITEHTVIKESLELHQEHLTRAQEVANIASWEYIIDEDSLLLSKEFYHLFDLDEKENLSLDKSFELVHPDDYENIKGIVSESVCKGISYYTDFRIYHEKTNELKFFKVKADAVWKNQKPYKLIGIVHDITTQKRMENKLRNTIKELRHVYDHLNVGIWMRENINGQIVFASKGLEEILQIPLPVIYDNPDYYKDMILPAYREDVFQKYQQLKEGNRIEIIFRLNSGDGTTKWLYEQTVPWVDEEGKISHLFGLVADISSEVEMKEKLNYMAKYDLLTGLPNQKNLYDELDTLCKRNDSFAMLYLDLDRFHVINNSLGHQIGDKVLKSIASRLLSSLPKDGYIARIGSNDFIIILKDTVDKNAIFTFAERLMEKIEKTLVIDDYELHITTSIGISFFPENGDNKLTLLENAHAALYYAKQQGKNNYQLYSFSKDIPSYKKYVLEKEMRKAINNEEFEIYYQPQVEPRRGIIQGAEALLRWHHKEWGMVSPAEFIPLAEENHLIHQIGDWVIKRVCAQLREWKDQGLTLRPISINISPIRLLKKGLVDLVQQQLELHQIPAKYLIFEITERTLLKSEKTVFSILKGLRKLGVRIAIDDFGTGYSSLHYLKEFEVDLIKIDKSFVENIDGEKEVAIVSSILHLAKGMDLTVVAEGVEEFEQFDILKQKECDIIQGYLFSEPVPLEKFESMMKVGLLKPTKNRLNKLNKKDERRRFYRLEFLNSLLGEMTITEVKKKKVNLGTTEILIGNISLGGIKIHSSLKLPINADIKYRFKFEIMKEVFILDGILIWKDEYKGDTFFYGVEFQLNLLDEERLAGMINKMSAFRHLNQEIPDTKFINGDSYVYLKKELL